ncbi:MAG: M20/M25/M40 family metallo-hydrolase [Proteobacteria bacterium]|nr:M20/M25/M40 family metallo-hydrolase [Pseudomonadota bacterium]
MNNQTTPSSSHLARDAIALLKKMIATPSFSREEEAVATLMMSDLSGRGLEPFRSGNNVFAKNRHFDSSKPTILINSHLDTVKPNSGYTRDPFTPEERDGKLFGLGSNDAGASVVAMLSAFRHFYERKDLRYNLVYAATAEEEISGKNGIEALLPEFKNFGIPSIDCALVGEPTGMQMAVAEKGLLVLDCVAIGKSGHAARDEGDNAIYKAMGDLEWFRDFNFEKVSPLLGPNKMTVTIIESGSQHNVVPRECRFTVDVRVNELYTFDMVLETIRAKVKSEVKPRSVRIKSTSIEETHPLVRAGASLGLKSYGSPTTSDEEGIATYIALLSKVVLE